jgi:UTP-glucose-1-phosphate uridylyltransferase
VSYVIQEINKVPENFSLNPERTKPWGTAHAILMAKDVINEPFAVINADDFYGEDAFKTMFDFLSNSICDAENCMIGYRLENTISETGSVSRGVCSADNSSHLSDIIERTQIEKVSGNIAYKENDKWNVLLPDTIVSMNFWGFTPQVFKQLESQFSTFLKESGDQLKSEYFITTVISEMMSKGISQFRILKTDAEWFGVTYQEDKTKAIDSINALIENGSYPSKLWN